MSERFKSHLGENEESFEAVVEAAAEKLGVEIS